VTSKSEAVRTPRGSRSTAVVALAVISALALLAVACGNSKTSTSSPSSTSGAPTGTGSGKYPAVNAPGVSATEIQVGGVASITNPLGGNYGDIFKGVDAYFSMINSQGGIYGRKLVLADKLDDQLANNQAQVNQLLTQDNVFSVIPVAVLLFTGANELVAQNVPTFGWAINAEWQGTTAEPRSNMFGQSGSFLGITDPTPVLPWLAQQKHATKLGLLAYSVAQSADCATGVTNSFDKYGASAGGAKVVFEDKSLAFGTADLSVQVSKMKAAGVDMVATCMDTNGVVTLAKEMHKQQLNAIQYLPDAYDHTFLSSYGDLFEGSVVRTDFTQFELPQQPPGLVNYLKWIKTQNTTPSEDSMNGWLNADLFYNGLKAAGPNFSRQSMMDAINKMTRYQANGLLYGVNWTVAHTASDGTYCQFFSTIESGKYVTNYSKPGKPFVCVVDKNGKLTAQYAN
jgi:branched-chain amino acid transport system substrate-binding protein